AEEEPQHHRDHHTADHDHADVIKKSATTHTTGPTRSRKVGQIPKTDPQRTITYDPDHRPEIANLLLTGALCTGTDPADLADSLGDRGASALKTLVTESVNEHLRPLRRRRAELATDPGYLHHVLSRGNAHANRIAEDTLNHVRQIMDMSYPPHR
ncbi:MAG: tryptophan--tRNA ligase, partial [Actinomycetota bacterium]|nr:tryptophan--tRNA ligase [Actinomycetota bacterium]